MNDGHADGGHVLRPRHLLFPIIVAIHISLLLIIMLAPPMPAPVSRGGPLTLFEVAGPEEKAAVPEPEPAEIIRPEPIVKLEVPTVPVPAEPVFDQAAAEQAGFGTTCDIADTLARAFEGNEQIRAALAAIRPEERSVANAIMLWDSQWVDINARAGSEKLDLLRRAIMEGIAAAPPECLAQEVTGPRFIPVAEASRTTVLVLGSGSWRWDQLVLPAAEGAAAAPARPANRRGEAAKDQDEG